MDLTGSGFCRITDFVIARFESSILRLRLDLGSISGKESPKEYLASFTAGKETEA
jgi:hypothetical protein